MDKVVHYMDLHQVTWFFHILIVIFNGDFNKYKNTTIMFLLS